MTSLAEESFSKEAFNFSKYLIERTPNEWNELDFLNWLNGVMSCFARIYHLKTEKQDGMVGLGKQWRMLDLGVKPYRYRDMAQSVWLAVFGIQYVVTEQASIGSSGSGHLCNRTVIETWLSPY
ncbi:6099_t:CDS:2, partial [Acaulospora colombiana]